MKERAEDIEPNLDFELARYARLHGEQVRFNREARAHFLRFATSADAAWTGNFRDLGASISALRSGRGAVARFVTAYRDLMLRRIVEELLVAIEEGPRAAVLAVSSRHEGFCNVIAEALACGCPVVSTDCPSGPSEILDGGRFGRLVPVGDDAAMAEALEATLTARPAPDLLRARGREFSLARAVDRYEQLLFDGPSRALAGDA